MKKLLSLILIFLLITVSLFAYSYNNQKIYNLDTDIYEAISMLYIMQGNALPSTTGPYSEAEFINMLSKINYQSLPKYGKEIYEYIESVLNKTPSDDKKEIALIFGFNANLEIYAHTNTTNKEFQTKYNWGFDINEQKPLINLSLETWPAKNFYGYFEYSLENCILTETIGEFGSNNFHSNILGLQNFNKPTMTLLNGSVPYRSFASFGGNLWSFQVGRERLSWGAGESGNLIIGDHLLFHNMARITTFSRKFKYTFLTSFFPHPLNYYTDGENSTHINDANTSTILSSLSMYMGHRLEMRFLNDKINLAVTESIMFETRDSFLDLQILNPSMLYHNYYIRQMANSLLTFEIDYTPYKYFNIYSQLAIDEFSIPGESKPGVAKKANPNAFGIMLGIKGNYPLEKGILSGSIEFVKTDPYLYLRNGKDTNGYGLDYIVAIRQFADTSSPKVTYNEAAIGYKWANDAMVLNFNIGYKQYGKWEVEGNALLLWDGTYDIWTAWSYVTNSENEDPTLPIYRPGPTDNDEGTYNYKDPNNKRNRDSVTLMTNLSLKCSYSILDYLKIYGQLDYFNIQNPGNSSTASAINDIQLTLGIGYSF